MKGVVMKGFGTLGLVIGLAACNWDLTPEIKQASQHYQQIRDFSSLQVLHDYLQEGMSRSDVESLLGDAVYSPTEGVDYYPGDKAAQGADQQMALVIDYINAQGETTEQVQSFWLGKLGE